jgi:hypothetical protein
MPFQAVHRLPGGPNLKNNIFVRFVSLLDKDLVNQGLKYLKAGCGFSVCPDLPPKLNATRNNLLATRSRLEPALKSRTKLVYLKESPWLKLVTKSVQGEPVRR